MAGSICRPLSTATSIRLLNLLPDKHQSPLRAQLVERDLARSEPEYEALSYTWGDATASRLEVQIDDYVVSIRHNLFDALRWLRRKDEARLIYVDAVCINQSDLIEKSQQVAMMGDVYGKAKRVVAWVGEHADGSEQLFRTRTAQTTKHGGTKVSVLEAKRRLSVWTPFLRRPFFRRLWIVQELVVAKAILVQCGHDCASWEDLLISRCTLERTKYGRFGHGFLVEGFDGIDNSTGGFAEQRPDQDVFELHERFFRYPGPMENLSTLINARKVYQEERPEWQIWQTDTDGMYGRVNVIDLMRSFKRMQCSDWHDYVYAMLSLETDKQDRPCIKPDYGSSRAELFTDVCLKRLRYIHTQDIRGQRQYEGGVLIDADHYNHHAFHQMAILSRNLLPDGRRLREVLEPVLLRYDAEHTTEQDQRILALILLLLAKQEALPSCASDPDARSNQARWQSAVSKLQTPKGRHECLTWLRENKVWLQHTPALRRSPSVSSDIEVGSVEDYLRPLPPRRTPHQWLWKKVKDFAGDAVRNLVPLPDDII